MYVGLISCVQCKSQYPISKQQKVEGVSSSRQTETLGMNQEQDLPPRLKGGGTYETKKR